MIRPCRLWQCTRHRLLLHPHPHRRLCQLSSRISLPLAYQISQGVVNTSHQRVVNRGAAAAGELSHQLKGRGVERKRPLPATAKEIFNDILRECGDSHPGHPISTIDYAAMHTQVGRVIYSWLVKDWRHTPYASLIALYGNYFLGSAPRTLLHTDPTVILIQNILESASKGAWPARTSERAAKIVGNVWSKGHTLSPRALVSLCNALHPSVLPLFHNHFIALTRRLRRRQERGGPEGQDESGGMRGVYYTIATIFERLIELAWQNHDYAAVSALFAHMRMEGVPLASNTACKRVLRSEFTLFEEMSRIKPQKEEIATANARQMHSLERLFENIYAVLLSMLDRRACADNATLAMLTRGFFGVVDVTAKHRRLKWHRNNAIYVLRMLREVPQQQTRTEDVGRRPFEIPKKIRAAELP